ncbi:DUF1707 domain-containing protein [Pseudonocardia sp. Ae707_Ps2]|uniref:DUF1707 SHOCT-like domain-containing protein n=2 Tax=Pseudonocardia TaxID=1847 RepID=UPI0009FA2FA7
MRISDADREAAARRLHDALGEGRITLAELEERLDAVYAARVARDLRPPLADLPEGGTADVDGTKASWGEVKTKVPSTPGAAGPHVVVHGKVGMGSVTVRGPRRSWWRSMVE